MYLKDLLQVTTNFNMYMHNTKTGEVIILDQELLKSKKLKIFSQNPIPFIDRLKIKDIYADCGLQVEIKFDKDFYKAIKKYQKHLTK